MNVTDVCKDFQDGLKLIALYEAISGKTFPNYQKKPTMKIHMINNLYVVFYKELFFFCFFLTIFSALEQNKISTTKTQQTITGLLLLMK